MSETTKRQFQRWITFLTVWVTFYFLMPYIIQTGKIWGIRLLIDPHDLRAYFVSSSWVVQKGSLYVDFPSDYPLFPNLIFALARYVSLPFASTLGNFPAFVWTYASMTFCLSLIFVKMSIENFGKKTWLLVVPSILYFTLYRFDFYPCFAFFLGLLALRKDHFYRAALCIGIAIALKGYALFALPALAVYSYRKLNVRAAFNVCLIAVAPFIIQNLFLIFYIGFNNWLPTYAFHMKRSPNGESIYDAARFLAKLSGGGVSQAFKESYKLVAYSSIPNLLQAGFALLGALTLPKNFQQFLYASLVGISGFLTFSVFYSPQFVIWLLPFALFAQSRFIFWAIGTLAIITIFQFPIFYDLQRNSLVEDYDLLEFSVLLLVSCRLSILFYSLYLSSSALVRKRKASVSVL